MQKDGLIYDWNTVERRAPVVLKGRFELHDETMRDGLQNPSVIDPPIADKLEILHLLDQVGVDTCDVGLPGAGPRAFEDVLRLCREMGSRLRARQAITSSERWRAMQLTPWWEPLPRRALPICSSITEWSGPTSSRRSMPTARALIQPSFAQRPRSR